MAVRDFLKKGLLLVIGTVLITAMGVTPTERPIFIKEWQIAKDNGCEIKINQYEDDETNKPVFNIDYQLKSGFGWVEFKTGGVDLDVVDQPISFKLRARSSSDFEIKFVDEDGSVFGRKISLKNKYQDWEEITVSVKNLEHWWGGDNKMDKLVYLALAVSGSGEGSVELTGFKTETMDKQLTFKTAGAQLDPNRKMGGTGFEARRAKSLTEENDQVLKYLKLIQDRSSSEQQLLPSMEGLQAQTYNNAVVAMAYILKDQQERAERILDFYSYATIKNNSSKTLQNFYYKGEPRGFFQHVVVKRDGNTQAYHHTGDADRWMGDMAWLWLAYEYYARTYDREKYKDVSDAILNLMKSWYVPSPQGGGYVQHGGRDGDKKMHEGSGHHEGNIDAYAVFRLSGDKKLAANVKKWLERELSKGEKLPLDLYTWRVLAYEARPELLDKVEYDLRYRKIVDIDEENKAMGFFHEAHNDTTNVWLDGLGHMACAYYVVGNKARANFYANQMDAFLVPRQIDGEQVMAMPYTLNRDAGYGWVDPEKGFISTCAWYIFAKNKFNPMTLKKY